MDIRTRTSQLFWGFRVSGFCHVLSCFVLLSVWMTPQKSIPPGEDESKIHRRGWRRAQGWKEKDTHQKSPEIMIAMQPIQDGWEGHSYRQFSKSVSQIQPGELSVRSGKHTKSYEQSPFVIGKSTINHTFHRVSYVFPVFFPMFFLSLSCGSCPRRITWLNANVFPDRNINDQVGYPAVRLGWSCQIPQCPYLPWVSTNNNYNNNNVFWINYNN